MYKLALVLPAFLLVAASVLTPQQSSPNATGQNSGYSAIPVEAAKQQNPVKPSPESTARAKKWWAMDCEMCHNKIKNGHNNMPAEGPRLKAEEVWDLVNHVRAFAKKKDADTKTQ